MPHASSRSDRARASGMSGNRTNGRLSAGQRDREPGGLASLDLHRAVHDDRRAVSPWIATEVGSGITSCAAGASTQPCFATRPPIAAGRLKYGIGRPIATFSMYTSTPRTPWSLPTRTDGLSMRPHADVIFGGG